MSQNGIAVHVTTTVVLTCVKQCGQQSRLPVVDQAAVKQYVLACPEKLPYATKQVGVMTVLRAINKRVSRVHTRHALSDDDYYGGP